MYSIKQGYILGFHGCDKSVVDTIVNQKSNDLNPSTNEWDWLGTGMYFWENNHNRALEWAKEQSKNPKSKIKNPSVLGAIINLGNCLDLLDSENLKIVETTHKYLDDLFKKTGNELPINSNPNGVKGNDNLIRKLDCMVINTVHKRTKDKFDSVRAVFFEGNPLYSNSGLNEKNHIQIAIRNPNCVKGYFIPKSINKDFNKV